MPTPVTPGVRLLWPDLAKGVCILLVVLHHVITKHYAAWVPDDLGRLGSAWLGATYALRPVRMPLFFVISGMFAARAVHRPWRQAARRAAGPYYLYVVWLLLLAVAFSVERTLPMNRTQDLGELLADLVLASTGLWFLYALSAYFVLARLLAPVPSRWLLPVAAAGSMAAHALPLDEVNRVSVLAHFFWFLVGTRCVAALRGLAALEHRALLPALVVGYAVVAGVLAALRAPQAADVLLGLLGVPAAVLAAARIATRPPVAGPLARLGRRTLPVYVLHVPVLAVAHHLVEPPPVGLRGAGALVVAGYPLLLTAAVVATCLAAHALMVRSGLGALFELPRRRSTVAEASEVARRGAVISA
ncbi:acyltransferase family protein [Nocardioides sp. MAHUQ-72]|uniref:acyltransferase family protein n=1 Tax=unclassified Nocardioides TaxID=2615069 RepID=UPI00361962E3